MDVHRQAKSTFSDLFQAAELHENATLITGSICGYRIEDLDNPLTKSVRITDKLVDELAKGRPMVKVLRQGSSIAVPDPQRMPNRSASWRKGSEVRKAVNSDLCHVARSTTGEPAPPASARMFPAMSTKRLSPA